MPQLTLRPGDSLAIWAYDARLRRLTREPLDVHAGHISRSGHQRVRGRVSGPSPGSAGAACSAWETWTPIG
jgi:hypothetical protein